jgi:hypothetical protein
MKSPITVLYEVYEKRLLLDGIAGLPVLDRDTNLKRARVSARAWGGLVVRAECRIHRQRHPMLRDILAWTIVYVAPPARKPPPDPTGGLTLRALKGKLQRHGRAPTSRFDRRKPKNPPTPPGP